MVATTDERAVLELVDETCVRTPGRDLAAAEAEDLARLLKALADPVRLRFFVRLATSPDEVCVCDFPDVGVSQPTVSHHLKKLREAGLVESERRGTWVYYRPVKGALEKVGSFIPGLSTDPPPPIR
ncbi:ArsR/SmtB family transcription factor [Demetria terragena]|uniref:ArsR/SmtB family transcription factor n=1 Tax=Demetria terragena TaxID=63959 RepID=UPI000A026FDB|nr:metalloregulator ArsR/SmtB family transcription factor [Demetria terragena]